MSKLALFDFDGTLTTKDTLFVFTRFVVGDTRFYFGLIVLFFPLILQRVSLLSAHRAKEIFLKYFFRKKSINSFDQACIQFTQFIIPEILRDGTLDVIATLKLRGYRIIIVSASPQNWIIPWASQLGIDVIGTKLEVKDGFLTGNIEGKNCNYEEKVNRIREYVVLENYSEILGYGDSKGDEQMLSLAQQQFYRLRSIQLPEKIYLK